MKGYYFYINRRARDSMSGGFNYQYAEYLILNKYGDNEYTNAFLDALPQIEDLEVLWRDRKKNSV